MKLRNWFSVRKPEFIRLRVKKLLSRYHYSPAKAVERICVCLKGLADQGCAPTFATPGIVVNHYPKFFRYLQDAGAEIAVHGYQHLDLSAYSVDNAYKQLKRASEAFIKNGLEVYGFRCPYLGCTDELLDEIPNDLFQYSSNKAIYWQAPDILSAHSNKVVIDNLRRLYRPKSCYDVISMPYTHSQLLEIPVCLPDDMELIDGLQLSEDHVANVWGHILNETHRRGELFTLIFHPELASLCDAPFQTVIRAAKTKKPEVWIARLRDIHDWWSEKSACRLEVTPGSSGLKLDFICSQRATILIRGYPLNGNGCEWDGQYQRLLSKTLDIPPSPRPFIGIAPKTPQKVISFLSEQGYILDTSEQAAECSIYLDDSTAELCEVQLIEYIESSTKPLVRYWRWPNGAKSAMSITGDLDALTLLDYASRIFIN